MPVPNYDEAMARKMYQNLMDYQGQNIAAQNAANIQNQFQDYAQGISNLMPVQSQPAMGTMPNIPQQNATNINQAMQTYQNLLNQGAANYQAAMQQPLSPSMGGAAPAKRKSSTSFRTPPIQAF